MIKVDKSIIKQILLFLEFEDLQNFLKADCNIQCIIEDPIFWEEYLRKRKRKLPSRPKTVCKYYLDYYNYVTEANKWVTHMENNGTIPPHDPIYIYYKPEINNWNSKKFSKYPQIEENIVKIKELKQDTFISGIISVNSLGFYKETLTNEFQVYCQTWDPEQNMRYEKTIIITKEEMTEIFSILLKNKYYPKDYDGTLFKLPI